MAIDLADYRADWNLYQDVLATLSTSSFTLSVPTSACAHDALPRQLVEGCLAPDSLDVNAAARAAVAAVGGSFSNEHLAQKAHASMTPGASVHGESALVGEVCRVVFAGFRIEVAVPAGEAVFMYRAVRSLFHRLMPRQIRR